MRIEKDVSTEALDYARRELNRLHSELNSELHKKPVERLPLYEAELALKIKVANNEIRRLQGLPPKYDYVVG